MKTSVAIIGAGPSGLMLGRLLARAGVDVLILERQSRDYVLGRIRAGLLESVTTDMLRDVGCGDRLDAEGLVHDGTCLTVAGQGTVRIDFKDLVGRSVTIYGQTELTRDLMDANDASGIQCLYEAHVTGIGGIDGDAATVTYTKGDRQHTVTCDFVAACDGFHGVGRATMPPNVLATYERVYPFGWLGILSDVPPCSHELLYASHPEGFALATMRSKTRTRAYIQVPLDTRVEDWPDDRFWAEYKRRLGPEAARHVVTGPSIEKSVAALRSFVAEPMRHGRLFLAGDAAHIVPPTGAKGLNLAMSDVRYLSRALLSFYKDGKTDLMESYSATCLRRIWKATHFSWWMTTLLHTFPAADAFEGGLRRAEFGYLVSSRAGRTVLAENYVGLPFED